ncbi:MAG: sensor histidine kinase [Devosia sp.]|jgi:signal transduction histidine kinase
MGAAVTSFFAGLGSRYLRLIEYFIPDEMRADREAANQARMFLISHSMGPILGNAVPLAVLIFNATLRVDAIILALAITAFWVFPFLLKRGINYELLVLTSVVDLNFCILWSCYFYGGVSSPTLPWLLIIPILSLFYIGGERRLQPSLLAISAVSFALFLALYHTVPPPPMNMPPYAVYGLGFVSTAAALAYVATMAIYYARIFDASIALETEVHRRRETADQLRKAIAEADRAGAAKAEFLARMSHELKTPLNAIIGYSQLLREEEFGDSAAQQDINRIHDAGLYLLRLINMILDLSKLEAGRMQFDIRSCDIHACVAAVVDQQRASLAQRGNSVVLDIDSELSEVDIDQARFGQVLGAVLENAGQYTENGLVTVIVRRVMGADNKFCVRVADTGHGIAPEVLATLFEGFQSSRDAASGRFGGTGTSLTVVYRLCQAMGGSITAESMVGVGSTFSITLPVSAVAPATAARSRLAA